MQKPPLHPLLTWLEQEGLSLYGFAHKKNLPWRGIYKHVNDQVCHPDALVLDRIATATDGAVSVQSQVDWFKKMSKRRERA